MRHLATLQRVKDVVPIYHPVDGSLTSLDLITFYDIAWQCVAKRDEFSPGDQAVYIEISTVVPDIPQFEFLRSKKFKVKTIRLLGQLSQGLVLPKQILFDLWPELLEVDEKEFAEVFVDGKDVTELIGVTRWEPPAEIKLHGGGAYGPFPDDVVARTDEQRIQSIPHILDAFHGYAVVATEKEDGTSATYFWGTKDNRLRICSRNTEKLEDDGSVYFQVLKEQPEIEKFLRQYPDLVLQGEITGPGIQKNRLGRTKLTFHAFNLYDRVEGDYVAHGHARTFVEGNGIPWVREVKYWPDFRDETIDSLLELAKGLYEGTTNPREGLVLRPCFQDRFSYTLGGRISCKVINNEYLLAGGE